MGVIIAIDGFSACGKSTLAKGLAKELSYTYLDTGAMYRAVTLFFLRQGIDPNGPAPDEIILNSIKIDFQKDGDQRLITLNGEVVEEEIRGMAVSNSVSEVAAIPSVRRLLVAQQRLIGQKGGCILDGRDIGTVVFPSAPLKIFLTATPTIRAQRRLAELQAKGTTVTEEEVLDNLHKRDQIDSTREDSPLRQAADAVLIDNSNLSPREQLEMTAVLARLRGA